MNWSIFQSCLEYLKNIAGIPGSFFVVGMALSLPLFYIKKIKEPYISYIETFIQEIQQDVTSDEEEQQLVTLAQRALKKSVIVASCEIVIMLCIVGGGIISCILLRKIGAVTTEEIQLLGTPGVFSFLKCFLVIDTIQKNIKRGGTNSRNFMQYLEARPLIIKGVLKAIPWIKVLVLTIVPLYVMYYVFAISLGLACWKKLNTRQQKVHA